MDEKGAGFLRHTPHPRATWPRREGTTQRWAHACNGQLYMHFPSPNKIKQSHMTNCETTCTSVARCDKAYFCTITCVSVRVGKGDNQTRRPTLCGYLRRSLRSRHSAACACSYGWSCSLEALGLKSRRNNIHISHSKKT